MAERKTPASSKKTRGRAHQATLDFPCGWGGARPGAGRKPKGERAGVPHRTRAALANRHPVHITAKVVPGLPNLRLQEPFRVLRGAFAAGKARAGSLGRGFRLVHFSVQSNHLHLICEATSRLHLTRGIQGLLVRVAKRLNKLWDRAGSVFADRHHDRILRTPREVRNALAYVLRNAAKHGLAFDGPDPCSSGYFFDGWSDWQPTRLGAVRFPPIVRAMTWLLNVGWRRHRLVRLDEVPG